MSQISRDYLDENFGDVDVYFTSIHGNNSIELVNKTSLDYDILISLKPQIIESSLTSRDTLILDKLGIRTLKEYETFKLKTIVNLAQKADLKLSISFWKVSWWKRWVTRPLYGKSASLPDFIYRFHGKYDVQQYSYDQSKESDVVGLISHLRDNEEIISLSYSSGYTFSCMITKNGRLQLEDKYGIAPFENLLLLKQ